MALAPRSSLRSLVLLMSHGKPRLSSFFSSSGDATGVPPAAPGADAPPAAQPPAPPGRSRLKLPVKGEFATPGGPRPRPRPRGAVKDVTDEACLNAPEDPASACPAPDHGSSSTLEPGSDKPPSDIIEDPRHPVRDPPRPRQRPPRAVRDVAGKACPNAPEDPSAHTTPGEDPSAHTTPGYGSCSTPDKPPCGASEDVKQRDVDPPPPAREGVGHPIPDPRGRGRDVAGKACPNAPEDHSAYTTPGYGSCSTTEPDKPPCGASEDVKQRDVDPPPHARIHRVVDPRSRGRGRRAVTDEPEQCTQEHPKYPVPDSSSDKVFSSCSSAVPPPCTPAAPDVQPPGTPAPPDRSGHKLPDHEESVVNPLPDPPSGNRLSPVIEEPAQCTLDNPKYPTPDHASSSPSEGASGELLEDPRHPLRDPASRT